jgi:3-oxoacyl-[acyl-carrier protein] reductase
MSKLNGKVAIVTGSSKGIGADIALQLAAAGASVAVNYASSKQGADRIVSQINGKGGKAIAVQADVAKEEDIRRLFASLKKRSARWTFSLTMPAFTNSRRWKT